MTDPNLTPAADPEAECKHMLLKRSKVGNSVLYRCQEPACQKLFSVKPFEITVSRPKT